MENKIEESVFNDEDKFHKTLTELLVKLLNEKLSNFLEYCILTNNAEPIKEVIDILNKNQF